MCIRDRLGEDLRPAAVRGADGVEGGRASGADGLPGGGEVGQHDPPGHAVDGQVVRGDDESALGVRAGVQQHGLDPVSYTHL